MLWVLWKWLSELQFGKDSTSSAQRTAPLPLPRDLKCTLMDILFQTSTTTTTLAIADHLSYLGTSARPRCRRVKTNSLQKKRVSRSSSDNGNYGKSSMVLVAKVLVGRYAIVLGQCGTS